MPVSGHAPAAALGAGAAPVQAESRIPVPLDSPAFAPALGAQISLFARDGVQTARLQLNPAEMGPITVQIALDGSAARVDFQADMASTREVIQASLPALAGALQEAGMTLAGGGVSQQPSSHQPPPQPAPSDAPRRSGERSAAFDSQGFPTVTSVRTTRGLVDLVA
jgi:flagellar hook-length control protein FliK